MGRLLLFLVCVGVIIIGVIYLSQEREERPDEITPELLEEVEHVDPKEETETGQQVVKGDCEELLVQYKLYVDEYLQYCDTVREINITQESIDYSRKVSSVQADMSDYGCDKKPENWSRFAAITSLYARAVGKLQSR